MEKKYLLLVFIFYITLNKAKSQHFNLISKNKDYFFEGQYKDIQILHFDSLKALAADTIFFPYRAVYKGIYSRINSSQDSLKGCINAKDTLWAGIKIIKKASGDYIFFNRSMDSIILKPEAGLNKQWKLFSFKDGSYIEAQKFYLNKDTTLGGRKDSLFGFSMQLRDKNGTALNHPVNGKNILFSRKHSLITIPDFYSFPENFLQYTFLDTSTTGDLMNFGKKEIYNFQVDDVFERFYNDYSCAASSGIKIYTRQKILSKKISPGALIYEDSIQYFNAANKGIWTAQSYKKYKVQDLIDLQNDLFQSALPGKALNTNFIVSNGAVVHIGFNSLVGNFLQKHLEGIDDSYYDGDSCLTFTPKSGFSYSSESFSKELGRIYAEYGSGSGHGHCRHNKTETLTYFKKGNKEFGEQVDFCKLIIAPKIGYYNIYSDTIFCNTDFGIKWYLNNKEIQGYTGDRLRPAQTGWYKVRLILKECNIDRYSDSINVTNVTGLILGLEEEANLLYPNPNKGIMTMNRPIGVKIYNVLGLPVPYIQNEKTISIISPQKGIYFLESEGRRQKFLIE